MSEKPSIEAVKQGDTYILVVNGKPLLAYLLKSPAGWELAGNLLVCTDEEAKLHNTVVGETELATMDKIEDSSAEFIVVYDEDNDRILNLTGEFEIARNPATRGHFLWFSRNGRSFAGLCFSSGILAKVHFEKESTKPLPYKTPLGNGNP